MKKTILLTALILFVVAIGLSQTTEWVQLSPSSTGTLLGSTPNASLLDGLGNNAGSQYGNSTEIYTAPEDIGSCDSVKLCIASPDTVSITTIHAYQWLRYNGLTPTGCDSIMIDTNTAGTPVNWLSATYSDTNSVGHLKFVLEPKALKSYTLGKWIQFRIQFNSSLNHTTYGTLGSYLCGTKKIRFYLKEFRH